MKSFDPDEMIGSGKRASPGQYHDPYGFPKRQKLDHLEVLYKGMVSQKSSAKNAERAWRNARDVLYYVKSPDEHLSEN
jgi:hypothetical protein